MFSIRNVLLNHNKVIAARLYSILHQQEFTVTPFCNINVNLPFNVTAIPLDVHNYPNFDKVIVKIDSSESQDGKLKFNADRNNVNISSNYKKNDAVCNIQAPFKANINVTTHNGNISIGNFQGDTIELKSENGNITTSRCQCKKISITNSNGNIECLNFIQAGKIYLKTKHGFIKGERLQGNLLEIETEDGNVTTESSYCNSSKFTTDSGTLNLRSAHKDCKVTINRKGELNMIGFDGSLHAFINEGNVNLRVSRMQENSWIEIENSGVLKLKVLEPCFAETKFKIIAKTLEVQEDLQNNSYKEDGCIILRNSNDDVRANVLVNCPNSDVFFKTLSWMELFNLKIPL